MEFNATFLATIITFIVFVFVMNKVLYRPILGIMEKRQDIINTNYKSREDNNAEMERLVAEKDAKLSLAKENARNKYTEIIDEFKQEKNEIVSEAQKDANNELEDSRRELNQLSDDVKNGLKTSINELANDIVEKVIGYRSDIESFDEEKINKVLWGQDS